MARIVNPDEAGLREAVAALARGALVAFPTETVYGLGALALRPDSVRAIFTAKGRPSTNPLIVHVATAEQAASLAAVWTPLARRLADAFWPGPLTVVVPRRPEVPDIVTAGGDTVALRVPAHPVARALLAALGQPVAAPSANRSGEVSPTTAAHVQASLGDRVDLIVDGGPCAVGIESTVVDATGEAPVVLRPGTLDRDTIASKIGGLALRAPSAPGGPLRSPGLLTRHYAPRARVVLASPGEVAAAQARLAGEGRQVGVLSVGRPVTQGRELPADPGGYARELYGALHALDERFDALVVELPPDEPAWEAVHDRLRRAAATE